MSGYKTTASGNSFEYQYTLINLTKASFDIDELKKQAEPMLLNNVKTSKDLQAFRDINTTLIYSYKDKDGVDLFKIIITPEQYK